MPFLAFFAELTFLSWVMLFCTLGLLTGATATVKKEPGASTVMLVILAILWGAWSWFKDVHIDWVFLGQMLFGYMIVGILYSVAEWILSIKSYANRVNRLKETKELPESLEDAPKNHVKYRLCEAANYAGLDMSMADIEKGIFYPLAARNVDNFAYWTGFWVFLLLNRFLSDFVSWLIRIPGRLLRPLMDYFSKLIVGKM